jgi:hypothetical protein
VAQWRGGCWISSMRKMERRMLARLRASRLRRLVPLLWWMRGGEGKLGERRAQEAGLEGGREAFGSRPNE